MTLPRRPALVRAVGLGVAVLALVGVLRALAHADDPSAKGKSDPAARPVPVTVAAVAVQDVPVWLEGLGTVAAWQQATVRSQVDGLLERVFFTEGQAVRKGAVLAQIDPRPFEVQLHQGEGALARDRALLAGAEKDLARYRELLGRSLVPQQQVDQQTALVGQYDGAVRVDEASVESARLNLDYARVRAPFDGTVGVRQVDPGNLVHATDAGGLVVLTMLDPVAVYVTLPEDDLPAVQAAMLAGGVPVEIWSRDGATRLGKGALAVIDNEISPATATLRLKARVDNPARPARALWPQQFVKARLLVAVEKQREVVPAASIARGPDGPFVYVVGADHKAEVRPVTLGRVTADLAIVEKGLRPGEQVVTEGQGLLRAGQAVQVRGGKDGRKGAQ